MRLILIILALCITTAFAEPTSHPQDTEQLKDAILLLQNESSQNVDRARRAELALAKTQRELADAQKTAAECEPKKPEKK